MTRRFPVTLTVAESPEKPPRVAAPVPDRESTAPHWRGSATGRIVALLRTLSERDGEIRMLGEEVRRRDVAIRKLVGALQSINAHRGEIDRALQTAEELGGQS